MSIVPHKLETACIDCTKFDPNERFGELLALVCHAAYLSVAYLASVGSIERSLEVDFHSPNLAAQAPRI